MTRQEMVDRENYLKKLISDMNMAIKKAPDGKLRCSRRGNRTLYYQRTDPQDTTGKYIKKKDIQLAKALAQKDYNIQVVRSAQNELQLIQYMLKHDIAPKAEDVYGQMKKSRQELIVPFAISNEDYAKNWQQKEYIHKEFKADTPVLYTNSGIRVRSKSEILIVDALERNGVPFRYEYPLHLKSMGTIHPDFTALNIRTRREFLWEHYGMMDDPDYIEKGLSRLEAYEAEGYFPGENLILTYETSVHPLNIKLVNILIKRYLI